MPFPIKTGQVKNILEAYCSAQLICNQLPIFFAGDLGYEKKEARTLPEHITAHFLSLTHSSIHYITS